jgi:superfamily II DNA/RNA helicase
MTRKFGFFQSPKINCERSSQGLSKLLRNSALNELPPNEDESDTRSFSEHVSTDLSSYAGSHEASADTAVSSTDLEHIGTAGTFRERFGKVIPEWLSDRLEQGGFSVPTSVQAEAIETVVVEGRDALVQAYTGT